LLVNLFESYDDARAYENQIHNYSYMDLCHWIIGLCLQVQYRSYTEMSIYNITSNRWRPTLRHQFYDPHQPRYSNCTGRHPHQKYPAPYKTGIPPDSNPLYKITSYEDRKNGGQLTCNEVNEISLEGTSSR